MLRYIPGDIIYGSVISYDSHVGLGEIRDENGVVHQFHCVNIADGSREIDVDQKVEAEVFFHPRGRAEVKNIIKK